MRKTSSNPTKNMHKHPVIRHRVHTVLICSTSVIQIHGTIDHVGFGEFIKNGIKKWDRDLLSRDLFQNKVKQSPTILVFKWSFPASGMSFAIFLKRIYIKLDQVEQKSIQSS
jgi:hypothetical protein